MDDCGADRRPAAERRRLPDRRLYADRGGGGAGRDELRDVRNRLRPGPDALLARGGRHAERADLAGSELPGRHHHRTPQHQHVRVVPEHRQPGPAQLPASRSLRDDVPRLGVVHAPKGERADQLHAALTAGDSARREHERAEHGRAEPAGPPAARRNRERQHDGRAAGQQQQGLRGQPSQPDRHALRRRCSGTGCAGSTSAWTSRTCSTPITRPPTRRRYSYTAPNGGTWYNPTAILGPRFMRLNFTLNY